jgi:hypothetical protein
MDAFTYLMLLLVFIIIMLAYAEWGGGIRD